MSIRVAGIAVGALFSCVYLGSSGRVCAQETRRQNQQQNSQRSLYRDEAQNSAQEQQPENIRSFRGKISQKENSFFLEELVHRTQYRLADTWEAKRFAGKKVRVTGWLDQDQKTLHVKSMSVAP